MNRRAFLLGAIAAPIAAPAVAQAAEPVAKPLRVIGIDVAGPGGDRTSIVLAEVRDGLVRFESVLAEIRADHHRVIRQSPPCEFWSGTMTRKPEI